jgi:hypothetical protein
MNACYGADGGRKQGLKWPETHPFLAKQPLKWPQIGVRFGQICLFLAKFQTS